MRIVLLTIILPFALLLAGPDHALEIHNGVKAGEFRIVNTSASVLRLSSTAAIERKAAGTSNWVATGIVLRLITTCPPPDETASMELAAKATFAPVAWTGYDCESQCQGPCRMNGWAGAGTYRLVLKSADGKRRWAGPEFHLRAERN